MAAAVFRTIGATFRRFNGDRCFRDAVIISYFALLCAVPLLALFAFLYCTLTHIVKTWFYRRFGTD